LDEGIINLLKFLVAYVTILLLLGFIGPLWKVPPGNKRKNKIATVVRFMVFSVSAFLVFSAVPVVSDMVSEIYHLFRTELSWFVKIFIYISTGLYLESWYRSRLIKQEKDSAIKKIVVFPGTDDEGKPTEYYIKEIHAADGESFTNDKLHAFYMDVRRKILGAKEPLDNNDQKKEVPCTIKAFLNATWKMTPQEIERANRASLSESENPYFFPPEVKNQDRRERLVQKDVALWGHKADVDYLFFDNMLYEYCATFTTYNKEKSNKEILETLRGQFGNEKEEPKRGADMIYSFVWDTETQTVSYWMGIYEKTCYVGVKAVYKPFHIEIEEIAKKEEKHTFDQGQMGQM